MGLNYHFRETIFRELVMNLGIGDLSVPLQLKKFLRQPGYNKIQEGSSCQNTVEFTAFSEIVEPVK
jgi:hypothetical protein